METNVQINGIKNSNQTYFSNLIDIQLKKSLENHAKGKEEWRIESIIEVGAKSYLLINSSSPIPAEYEIPDFSKALISLFESESFLNLDEKLIKKSIGCFREFV
ncbi:MAG: hypothetical protein MHPSP_001156, partial [Paramarteilia canceri]